MASNNFRSNVHHMVYVRRDQLQSFVDFAAEQGLFIQTEVSNEDAENAELPWAESEEEWDNSNCWDSSSC